MTALALPEPQQLSPSEWAAHAQVARLACAEARDLDGASELLRRLNAVRSYIDDKAVRNALEAEQRRTEVLIGELLGPAQIGRPPEGSNLELSDLGKAERARFRELAAHAEEVEELIQQGITKRAAILAEIAAIQPGPVHHCPTCGGRIPKSGIGRRLRNQGETQ